MAGSSNDARIAQREALLKRLDNFNSRDYMSSSVSDLAKYLLNLYPADGTHNTEMVEADIEAILPASVIILSRETFRHGTYAVVLLHDTARFFNAFPIPLTVLESLTATDRASRTIMEFVWIASAYGYDKTQTLEMVEAYRKIRFSNPYYAQPPGYHSPLQPPPSFHVQNQHSPHSVAQNETTGNQNGIAPSAPTAQGIHQGTLPPSGHMTASVSPQYPTRDTSKKAASIATYFKDSKFTGSKEQSIRYTLRDFEVCAHQFELSQEQRQKFLVNVFGGPARDFFFENTAPDMSFQAMVKVMLNEYDNDARQLAAQAELERITIDQVMKDKELTDSDSGLTKLVDKINALTPQAPPQFRSDEHKKRFLRKAVLTQSWAETPISQMTTARFTFNRFVTALREQIQLEEEKKTLSGGASYSSTGTFYQQYGIPPNRYKGRFRTPNKRRNPIGKDGKRMQCHICGSEDHFAKDHPAGSRFNRIRNNVAQSLKQGTPAIHVLSEVVNALREDETSSESDPEPQETTDLETFYAMTSTDHLDEPTTSEEINLTNHMDEREFQTHLSSTTSSPPMVNIVPRKQVRFKNRSDFRQDA